VDDEAYLAELSENWDYSDAMQADLERFIYNRIISNQTGGRKYVKC